MSRLPHIDLTVAIATYDRPASLDRTLRSCLAQTNDLGLRFDILVVDNHPSESGRAVVGTLASGAVPIRYVTDLTRNMSTLRNRAFAESREQVVRNLRIKDCAWQRLKTQQVHRLLVQLVHGGASALAGGQQHRSRH